MSERRRDNHNRILREGEYQRADGRYRYRYIDENGQEKNLYSWRLDRNGMPMVAPHWEKYMAHAVTKYNKLCRMNKAKESK